MNNFCLKQGQGLKGSAAAPKLHLSSPRNNFQLQLGADHLTLEGGGGGVGDF